MSLDFNFTNMIERLGQEEYDRITDHPTEEHKWHPVTSALIWATMTVGLGSITEANADKFADRLIALQAVAGGDLNSDEGSIYITREDVKNHIGLRTNVGNDTDSVFRKRLYDVALDRGKGVEREQGQSAHSRVAEIVAGQAKS